MVGVPRSQGCRNCRRKKKGCDLVKPTCGQCARLKVSCEWDKRWTFVSQDQATISGASKLPVRRRSVPNATRESSESLEIKAVEHSLTRTAFEIGSIGEFWERFLPKDNFQSVGGVYAGYWVKTVQDLAALDQTANLALRACSLTALGSSNPDPALRQEGTRLYARALRETNEALQDPVRAQSDAILASCKLLSMYENFRLDTSRRVSTQGQDWHKHIEGICRIIELRGPSKHVSHHGHALFEDSRLSAIIAGITLRKPNFLSDRAWHTIPWESSPRNLRDELCDIMVALPDLLFKQDALSRKLNFLETKSDIFSVLTEAQEHINRCVLVGTSLKEWEERALSICLEKASLQTSNFAGPLTLLEVCKDHGYGFFHVVMVYYAACIILYGSTWIIKSNITAAASQHHPLPALMKLPEIPTWMTPRIAASNIAKCAAHYMVPEQAGFWGPLSATFPMGTALHFYAATGGQDSAEMQQLRQQFARGRPGHVAGEFLRSMANTGDTTKGDPAILSQHTSMAKSWYGADVL